MDSNATCFRQGIRDGIPIALGYFAVAFTLGFAAKNAGFSALQAMVESLTNNASAGEYAVFSLVSAGAGYWEVAVMTLVTNARYLLMSCSLSQKLPPDTPLYHRMLLAYDVTDEIFGISIAVPGKLNPWYSYGAISVAIPGWGLGDLPGRGGGEHTAAAFGQCAECGTVRHVPGNHRTPGPEKQGCAGTGGTEFCGQFSGGPVVSAGGRGASLFVVAVACCLVVLGAEFVLI